MGCRRPEPPPPEPLRPYRPPFHIPAPPPPPKPEPYSFETLPADRDSVIVGFDRASGSDFSVVHVANSAPVNSGSFEVALFDRDEDIAREVAAEMCEIPPGSLELAGITKKRAGRVWYKPWTWFSGPPRWDVTWQFRCKPQEHSNA